MAAGTNTTSTLSPNLWSYYNKRLLERLVPQLRLYQFGDKRPLPAHMGKTVEFLRYNSFAVTDAQVLAEGTPPTDTALSSVNVTAEVIQYGNYTKIADLLVLTAIDPVINSAVDILSENAARKMDTIIRDVLDTNGANQFANGQANLAATGSGDYLTAKEFLKAATTLKSNNVSPIQSGDFVSVIHPACSYDVMNDTATGSWIDINKYTGTTPAFMGEIGKVYGVRVVESNNISSTVAGTEGGAKVYSNLVMGKESFGIIELSGQSLKTFVKQAGSAGTADPLDQLSTVGFKFTMACCYFGGASVYDTDRVIRIRAATASGI